MSAWGQKTFCSTGENDAIKVSQCVHFKTLLFHGSLNRSSSISLIMSTHIQIFHKISPLIKCGHKIILLISQTLYNVQCLPAPGDPTMYIQHKSNSDPTLPITIIISKYSSLGSFHVVLSHPTSCFFICYFLNKSVCKPLVALLVRRLFDKPP